LEAWKLGSLEAWKLGSLEAWKLGSLEAWKLGSLEALYNFQSALPSLFPSGCAFLAAPSSDPLRGLLVKGR
jgi:hypothetical protein